jgi:mannitol/fructose-specific phosphotransferase system IIA component (Ntr-type)
MLAELLPPDHVRLNLEAATPEEALRELVSVLKLHEKARALILNLLTEREKLGSTGIGKGIAIPHCRSLILSKLTLAVGRFPQGVPFDALDKKPSHLFFLVAAPPRDKGNQYLLTLGAIAKVAKDMGRNDKLCTAQTPEEFLARLRELEAKGK